MIHTANHKYHYVSYRKMGAYLMKKRVEKFGSNRSEFVRYLNEHGLYRWDQSAYRKMELGLVEVSLDRLCEVCIALGIYPTEVLVECTYTDDD